MLPITEINIKDEKNILESRARPMDKDDNLAATCELIGWTRWDNQHLETL
jgi:hypothetical protein